MVTLRVSKGWLGSDKSAAARSEFLALMDAIDDDLPLVRALQRLLEPFAHVTTIAQGETYATLLHFPVWIDNLCTAFEAMEAEAHNVADFRNEYERSYRKEVFEGATFFRNELMRSTRFGPMLSTPSLALRAAALSPMYGHFSFVAESVRNQVWERLARDAKQWRSIRFRFV
jgi:hypothetical protein